MATFTTTIHALFDVDGTSPNRSWNPRPILQAAEIIVAHDIDSGDEAIVFGHESDLAWDTDLVVIELDILQEWELPELLQVVASLRGHHDFDLEDFAKHRRLQRD